MIRIKKDENGNDIYYRQGRFLSGVLSAEAAILQLKAYKTYDQLSFHTTQSISTLQFIESMEV